VADDKEAEDRQPHNHDHAATAHIFKHEEFGLGHFGHDFPGHVKPRAMITGQTLPVHSLRKPKNTPARVRAWWEQGHHEQRISVLCVVVGGEHERQVPDAMQETHQQHGRHDTTAEQAWQL
jgi:hypothetical protein